MSGSPGGLGGSLRTELRRHVDRAARTKTAPITARSVDRIGVVANMISVSCPNCGPREECLGHYRR